jgi:hypothetical protein
MKDYAKKVDEDMKRNSQWCCFKFLCPRSSKVTPGVDEGLVSNLVDLNKSLTDKNSPHKNRRQSMINGDA